MLGDESLPLLEEKVRRLEPQPDPHVVEQPLADGQTAVGTDPAAEQDTGRAVGAAGEDDHSAVDIAVRGCDADGARPLDEDAVGERVGEDRQVRPWACRIEVCKPRVPAHGSLCVHLVHDRVGDRSRESAVPRRELFEREDTGVQRHAGSLEVGLELGVRPAGPQFVVVRGCAGDDDAGVVRRAAADHARPELRAVLAVGLPGVRERQCPRIEEIGGPPAVVECTVIRSRLDETDTPGQALAEPRREDATRGPGAHHDHVV